VAVSFKYSTEHTRAKDIPLNTESKVGQWQTRTFNPDKIKKIGFFQTCISDAAGLMAANCGVLSPWLAELNANIPMPLSTWYNRYTASGGAVEPYIWNANDPTKTEYQAGAYWWPAFENFRLQPFRDWIAYFQAMIPLVVNWLAPGWLNIATNVPDTTADSPFLYFFSPHGKIPETRDVGMDFYNSCTAIEYGFNYLVDGFYEQCRYLHALGVTVGIHIGHPSQNQSYTLRPRAHYNDVMSRIKYGRVKVGLDAAVTEDASNGITATCAADLYDSGHGDGVGIEGTPDINLPTQMSWVSKPYDFHVLSQGAFPRIHPDYQASWAVAQGYPVMGSTQFANTYGANRWWYFILSANDFGLSCPDFTASAATIDAYLTAFATGTKRIFSLWPKSVCLLPYSTLGLAMVRRKTAASFIS